MFCKHKWVMLSETTTESKFEISMKTIYAGEGLLEKTGLPHQLCDADRKHIQVFACEKCGKMKRFVERI